jgi:phosphoadenosine phosphosulfate reductase
LEAVDRRNTIQAIESHFNAEDIARSTCRFPSNSSAEDIIRWAIDAFGKSLVLQTSAGIQSAVMLHLATQIDPNMKVVFVDTGYLPQETIRYMETLRSELSVNLTTVRPQLTPDQIESKYGKLWELNHTLYGEITKVEPMKRAVNDLGAAAVLSGVRAEQTANRYALEKVSYDMACDRPKVLPILDWSKDQIYKYLDKHRLPRHPLESVGFATVGDNHSSRAMEAGEVDERATRFGGKAQECGLHARTVAVDFMKYGRQEA